MDGAVVYVVDQTPLLTEIRDLLREIRDALAPVEEAPADECQHPDEKRVDMRSIHEREHWICSSCKYEHVA